MKVSIDPRNKEIKVWINGTLYPREAAKISVFDSAVQGGDSVWEGLRVYNGRIAALDAHLKRLHDSAHALAFAQIPSMEEIRTAIFATLQANQMHDDAHIRLTLTRGEKITSGMNPRLNQAGPTLIVLAEFKPSVYNDTGIEVITASVRRNTPQCLDSKIHHNNLLNNILACLEANASGADSAVMLDIDGFISETNDTNLFVWREGTLLTPFARACLPGITRKMILQLAKENDIDAAEADLSLTELYTADEAFTTGTMGELTPITKADGRVIGSGTRGPITERLQKLHRDYAWHSGTPIDG